MTSLSIVRRALPDDKPELWRLLRILWGENAIFPIDNDKVDYYLDRLLNPVEIPIYDQGPRGVIGVIGCHGALEGMILMIIGTQWYSSQWSLDELANFVDPEHRRSNHAKELISYAKDAADELGVRLVIGVLSTFRTAAKVRLYERQLQSAGAFFIHPAPSNIVPLKRANRG